MESLNRTFLLEGNYEDDLMKFLKTSVPKILLLDRALTFGNYKNLDATSHILNQISWWIFGDDQNTALFELEKLNNPSTICGHVFKPGEATYTCRECAVDPTCVFCQPCFRKSSHIHHKYKLHSSGGGGCCDCGDAEAWTKYPSCNLHTVDKTQHVADARSKLPTRLRERAEIFFEILLNYAVGFLTEDRKLEQDLPGVLVAADPTDSFLTVVFNDESHTFDYVINVLQRAVSCSSSVAADFATIIDRKGRTAVLIGTEVECKASQDIIMTTPETHILRHNSRRTPLITKVIHSSVVAHQEFSLALLGWMEKISKKSEGLRQVISHRLLNTMKENEKGRSCAATLMLADTKLWKVARGAYQQLLMSTVLLQADTKRAFAVEYTGIYREIMSDFLLDDHDHSDSITSIAVQLFTVPTVVRYLVVNEDLLRVVLGSILSAMCTESNDETTGTVIYEVQTRKQKKNYRRLQFFFHDLRYVLTNVPSTWDKDLTTHFQSFFKMFVAFMSALEGLDSVVRKTDHHLEHEPDWDIGVTLQLRLLPVLGRLFQWCSSNKEITLFCIEETIQALKLSHLKEETARIKAHHVFQSKTFECIDYDITKKSVSVHYPLTRLVAGLLVQFGVLDIPFSENVTQSVLDIADRSYRALALCAQVNAGAWRRNGMSLANQVFYQREHQARTESFNRDIQLLQACAAVVDPDYFCISLQLKFNLSEHLLDEYMTSLYEEYLSIIIYVVAERYIEGIGKVTFEEKVKREVIHILASGPKPHSKIQKRLSEDISGKPGWEKILNEVAIYRPSTSIQASAKYELKVNYLDCVSPCFYHYSTATEQTNAQNETIRRKKANNQSCVFTPRPAPPFTKQFERVVYILQCSFFLTFLRNTLEKFAVDSPTRLEWSDKLFEKVLYATGFAVVEERERVKEDQNSPFKFCERAEESGLLESLRKFCEDDSVGIHKENLCWILNAVNDVIKRRLGIIDDIVDIPTTTSDKVTDGKRKPDKKKPHPQAKARFIEADYKRGIYMGAAGSDTPEVEAQRKKARAEERKTRLMEQMKMMQRKFLERHDIPVEDVEEEMVSSPIRTEETDGQSETPVCTSLSWQLHSLKSTEEPLMCILCQDDSRIHEGMVMSAFVQLSSVLSKQRVPPNEAVKNFGGISNSAGIHMSTCSHVMHFDCWSQYFESVRERDERRPHRMRRFISSFSTLKKEFLCPLCSRLSNCVIPVISLNAVATQRNLSSVTSEEVSLSEWCKRVHDLVEPPATSKQEVVIKLHLDESATSNASDQEEWHDAQDSPVEEMVSSLDTRASQEYMETDEDSSEAAYKVMFTCIRKNCVDEDVSNSILLWQAVVTTFQVAESVSRFQETPLLVPPSIRLQKTLSNIIRLCFINAKYAEEEKDNVLHEKLLWVLMGKGSDALLNMNIFYLFVRLIFACECLRSTIKTSSIENDKAILYICALAQIVQIMVYIDEEKVSVAKSEAHSSSDAPLVQLFNQVRSYANLPPSDCIDESKLEKCIWFSLAPFIRSCTLFMYYQTHVAPPSSLEKEDNLDLMLVYLGLPTNILAFFDASGTISMEPYVQRWCSHSLVRLTLENKDDLLTYPDLAEINTLVALEEDYSETIAKSSDFVCPRFGGDDDSVSPTLCLVCGAMLCSQSYCCQQTLDGINVGACTYHAHECSYGYGVFLRGRVCTVILHNDSRGSYRPAPFVDEYGETDEGLRRGNPLSLDKFRLQELNLLWLNHSIAETIVREMESNRGLINLDWNHL